MCVTKKSPLSIPSSRLHDQKPFGRLIALVVELLRFEGFFFISLVSGNAINSTHTIIGAGTVGLWIVISEHRIICTCPAQFSKDSHRL